MWSIVIKHKRGDTIVKQFPYKLQAVVWCYENGLVYSYRGNNHLNPYVEIRQEEIERIIQ